MNSKEGSWKELFNVVLIKMETNNCLDVLINWKCHIRFLLTCWCKWLEPRRCCSTAKRVYTSNNVITTNQCLFRLRVSVDVQHRQSSSSLWNSARLTNNCLACLFLLSLQFVTWHSSFQATFQEIIRESDDMRHYQQRISFCSTLQGRCSLHILP